ncbi:DnaJ C-terminal domain-containing protein [Undibacterium sp.]|jgi:curved DNA-binding protein|uniref:DnaJ C-terminal domain-containing protein n=1 Tax=Undibacterium sp. TaxID=1914977 RepID=UPI002CAE0CA2|nr:DnaJ C-terminal domain-containing protein [Undibacterium sp.]HTD02250.1 DnaJ C-terminal domain-containing protein [Undibacterium sp.]
MKYTDYYAALGVDRNATKADIKQAYRKLAHKYHPDISKDKEGESKFKEIAEAYRILKDDEKRAEYDQLGVHKAGEDFAPRGDFSQNFGDSEAAFADVDMADLMAAFAAARQGGHRAGGHAQQQRPLHGQDFEIEEPITLEQVYTGTEIDASVSLPEHDEHGLVHRVPRTFRVKIPKGAEDGQRLRLPGKGGPGLHGGKQGDLYIVMRVLPHPLYRVDGKELYMDLPLTPWEAVLGASVKIPTLGGTVEMSVPAGTVNGRQLRLAKRGLPRADGTMGNLHVVVRIEVPKEIAPQERELYQQLAAQAGFNPRGHFEKFLRGGA